MSRNKLFRGFGEGFAILALALLSSACQPQGNSSQPAPSDPVQTAPGNPDQPPETVSPGTSQPGTGDHTGDPSTATGTANIQLQGTVTEVNTNLGEKKKFILTLKAIGDFAGPVTLFADKADLDTNHKVGSDIVFTVTPSRIELVKDASTNFEVEVNVSSRAPSFKSQPAGGDGHFHVNAQADFGGQSILATMDVPLQVNPIYEVRLAGPGTLRPHMYDRPTRGEVAQSEIRAHTGGVTVRFLNYDTTETHIIHGNGLIPHQSTASPMAKAPAEGQAGGKYEVKIVSAAKLTGDYYCHSHEQSTDKRVILFNADL